ncbi:MULTISPECIES: universal stress protein [Bordetella]|uniref:Universal stress protein n=2 Tax=Bordetella TaxID=517 RepID=A0A261VQ49_9BORD|nr:MULTISPECIES: universal stress protein [Bordetella]MDM9557559.1 universal stress protein [Bordetella petrii]OZI75891.1 universal stress protein [Bordetella genomosp. 2]
MYKILVPIDGSECALRALDAAIAMAGQHGESELHLLNVPLPILSGHARMFLDKNEVQAYYDEEGAKALADAKRAAEQSGVRFVTAVRPGQSAQTIVDYARAQQCAHIVMGTRGLGALPGILLGSVANKVIHLADLPITLVK